MQQTWMPDVRPEVAPITIAANEIVFAAEVEEWLRAHPSRPVTWSPRGIGALAIHTAEELAARVGALSDEGSWGVVRRPETEVWAQCMRVDGGWIVEVNGILGPECYARRVQREQAAWIGGPRAQLRVRDKGRVMADYERQDVVPTASAVAGIMWSWLRGAVPADYELRDI